jgi:hypothetical protein
MQNQANKTVANPLEEQRAEALRHYDELSSKCHHWSSFVANAIKAYTPRYSSETNPTEGEIITGYLFDYPAAARSIALWLKDFCNEDLPYPEMIADAARKAAKEIDRLTKNPVTQWVKCKDRLPDDGCYHVTIEDGDKNRSGAYIEMFYRSWMVPEQFNEEGDLQVIEWLEEITV